MTVTCGVCDRSELPAWFCGTITTEAYAALQVECQPDSRIADQVLISNMQEPRRCVCYLKADLP